MTAVSKTKTSYYRRLYVAWLIEQGVASIPALMDATGMPRRTAQDTLSALAELDIVCEFAQTPGAPNHIGAYVIRDWGAINPKWIKANLAQIKAVLDYP
ncbi:hypothetical protein SAMN05216214_10496 [Atopomonas hussainii]|uniref:Helix-turn-helix domain-containing protein n=1 Tax=Atopomonas hussainii TaxID=1429083 RepID=A0A1H7IXC5_9GAMM|nr:winged helix-turn-helix domain-containing protein [Atopomonas hussainii]SEK66612.1 hypothetical protein SAMN05216214_10496 [Atopomonas hussainii]